MAYEVFPRMANMGPRDATVLSVRAHKDKLTFNQAVTILLRDHNVSRLGLLADRENRKAAVEFSTADDDDAYRITFHPSHAQCGLNVRSFMDHTNMLRPSTMTCTWDAETKRIEWNYETAQRRSD